MAKHGALALAARRPGDEARRDGKHRRRPGAHGRGGHDTVRGARPSSARPTPKMTGPLFKKVDHARSCTTRPDGWPDQRIARRELLQKVPRDKRVLSASKGIRRSAAGHSLDRRTTRRKGRLENGRARGRRASGSSRPGAGHRNPPGPGQVPIPNVFGVYLARHEQSPASSARTRGTLSPAACGWGRRQLELAGRHPRGGQWDLEAPEASLTAFCPTGRHDHPRSKTPVSVAPMVRDRGRSRRTSGDLQSGGRRRAAIAARPTRWPGPSERGLHAGLRTGLT